MQIEKEDRSTSSISQADLIELARETEAVWQRHVESRVGNQLPVPDRSKWYPFIAGAEDQVEESERQNTS